ncbi:MAG TPA: RNA polymerase sigma factor [Pirellulaceae bacterium]|nr:RNA polymerase sigma factor [Pirellulaceae bacterium]
MPAQDRSTPTELPGEPALVTAAVAGDRVALERLLLSHYDALSVRIAHKLPARLQATQAVEDILQLTFFQAFRDIAQFEPRNDAAFGDWLARIAENRLLDAIKQHDRRKRGGDFCRVEGSSPDDSKLAPLLDWIASDDPHPSSVVARSEALHALHVALASLEHDQREAIRLRLLEGESLEATAAALDRTPDAVRGLVHRGKQKLREAMGRASQWLSAK